MDTKVRLEKLLHERNWTKYKLAKECWHPSRKNNRFYF